MKIVDKLTSEKWLTVYFSIFIIPLIVIISLAVIEILKQYNAPLDSFDKETIITVKDKMLFEKSTTRYIIQGEDEVFQTDVLDFHSVDVNGTYIFFCTQDPKTIKECIIK